jgi:hypothetical protein
MYHPIALQAVACVAQLAAFAAAPFGASAAVAPPAPPLDVPFAGSVQCNGYTIGRNRDSHAGAGRSERPPINAYISPGICFLRRRVASATALLCRKVKRPAPGVRPAFGPTSRHDFCITPALTG